MCTSSRREAHIGQKRLPGERDSRRLAEKYKNIQKHTFLKMCTPSRREAHIGQKRLPGEREARRIAENYKDMHRHALLKMCTLSRPETYFCVIGAPGERQSRRYAGLFVVALKGACGSHFGDQRRSHEVQDLLRDGQRSANHDARLSFHKKH